MAKKCLIIVLLIVFIMFLQPNNYYIFAEENTEITVENDNDKLGELLEEKIEENEKENEETSYIKVTDLDIADYKTTMKVGEKQLLVVTVLPLDATDKKVRYYSSKESVAKVNELGRITALSPGTTRITIEAADGVSEEFKLKVVSSKDTYIEVSELDLGDYKKEMRVGDNQLLSVTVLPYDVTDKNVKYASSNEKVATVNGLGRITALSEGETVITVKAGNKENSFVLKVLPKKDTRVKDIDLGDYQEKMKVGETQLLMPAVIPQDAVNPGFKYTSTKTEVATINEIGRIRAHKEGTTVIIVEADGVKKQFELTVYGEIKAAEMDLGDYQKVMKVGDKQLLTPSVLPREASDRKITYKSTNEDVASVNVFGRIEAHAIGETEIIVSVDEIEKSFDLKVIENKDYPVEDIYIEKYEEKMEVGKTQRLSVTVLPYYAKDSTVEYSSEDYTIATVNSSGEIKAIKEGSTVINIKAGDVTKQITIHVVTATERIAVNKTYVVLKTGEQFQLNCKVSPPEANQKIEFKSNEPLVAKVDDNGLITAVDTGVATIIVTNGYRQTEVTVLVNKEFIKEGEEVIPLASSEYEVDLLAEMIKNSDKMKVVINKSEFSKVTKSAFKHLYLLEKILIVDGGEYIIEIKGNDIVNYENELFTNIKYNEISKGIEIIINENQKLPGKISISFDNIQIQRAKYLYLYNEAKKKYEVISNAIENGTITIDIGGKYLLTNKKLSLLRVNLFVTIIGGIGFLTMVTIYIISRRRYWFW
ncbi:Ig-like domain-containing protein [Acetivibrio clariflavus]|uniref:Ig-like domain-containing surface protein n=1 Tax=Acetivibrio clariflavus (strain DSM 19732 / NBRC 101661 / EBR45) TaxID=720554 RepID=G8LVV0_ACECE|nr:Ig-like domain-containing protein [Acetivibrio clariflavus]AEV67517.1 Ig-like domain-containing surface protein [Acetivibrio clariflavus DSM 19732]